MNMKNMARATATAMLVAATMLSHGADFYLKSGATAWNVAASYCTDAARTVDADVLPGPEDAVHVLAETFVFDCSSEAGRASFAAVSNVYEVLLSEGTVLEFNIPSGEAAVGCRMRIDTTDASRNKATLVKKGAGILSLLAIEPDGYLYAMNMDIRAGGLKISQGTIINQYFGNLSLASGATLWNPCSSNTASMAIYAFIRAEEGSLITNATSRVGDGHVMRANPTSGYNEDSYIKGVVGKGIRIWTVGNLRLEGVDNTMTDQVTAQDNMGYFYSQKAGQCRGVVLVKKFGMSGSPSSMGPRSSAYLTGRGAGFRYIGSTGDKTDKTFILGTYDYPAFFDAGPFGGLEFTGTFALNKDTSASEYGVRRLWLIGSNTTECVVAGDMSRLIDANNVTYPAFITKSGSGTWRFTDTISRYHKGGTAVLDGILKFDSIDEKGMWCSLGDSSLPTTDEYTAVVSNKFTDYAFTLGGADGDPVFEYSGSEAATCTTRPIALAGRGGHLRASNGRLTFGGVYARDANSTPAIVLDGTGTNELRNVSDGAQGARVSVVKDGAGTWTLAGDQTFSGGITVSNGTLSVRAPVALEYANYKWFKLSIARIGAGAANLRLRQICLFDKDGVRQNEGLTLAGTGTAIAPGETGTIVETEIAPGQVYFDKSSAGRQVSVESGYGYLDQAFDGIFDGSAGGRFFITWRSKAGNSSAPNLTDRSTWIPIVMHLADSANPITHFDVQGYSSSSGTLPTRILMEASTDGLTWHEVWSNLNEGDAALAANISGYNQWISDCIEAKNDSHARPLNKDRLTLSASGGDVYSYFSWFRFSVAQIGVGGNSLRFRQLGLYDEFGTRLNVGLTLAEPTSAIGVVRTILGTVPAAGQVGYDASAAGLCIKRLSDDGGEIEACFCDIYGGTPGRCMVDWYKSDGTTALAPNVTARKTWIPIVMHLAAPVKVHHFDVQAYHQGLLDYVPVRILLEGSVDGKNWIVMYNNATEGEAFNNTTLKYNRWLSDGVEASNDNHARPAGKGFNVLTPYVPAEPAVTQFPDGMRVQVLSGGTLEANTTNLTVGTLAVDAKSAGAIKGFSFGATGTLDVRNWDEEDALPGVYTNCEGLENLANWTLLFDGQARSGRRASVSNGTVLIFKKGVAINFR